MEDVAVQTITADQLLEAIKSPQAQRILSDYGSPYEVHTDGVLEGYPSVDAWDRGTRYGKYEYGIVSTADDIPLEMVREVSTTIPGIVDRAVDVSQVDRATYKSEDWVAEFKPTTSEQSRDYIPGAEFKLTSNGEPVVITGLTEEHSKALREAFEEVAGTTIETVGKACGVPAHIRNEKRISTDELIEALKDASVERFSEAFVDQPGDDRDVGLMQYGFKAKIRGEDVEISKTVWYTVPKKDVDPNKPIVVEESTNGKVLTPNDADYGHLNYLSEAEKGLQVLADGYIALKSDAISITDPNHRKDELKTLLESKIGTVMDASEKTWLKDLNSAIQKGEVTKQSDTQKSIRSTFKQLREQVKASFDKVRANNQSNNMKL